MIEVINTILVLKIMTKRIKGDFMPFHNFTGAVKIKTGDVVSESKSYKVRMNYKQNKRQHKFY